MPFGLNSTPEIFQTGMDEIIEGIHGIEVYMDDLLILGQVNYDSEGKIDHDRKLCCVFFSSKSEKSGFGSTLRKLNSGKQK